MSLTNDHDIKDEANEIASRVAEVEPDKETFVLMTVLIIIEIVAGLVTILAYCKELHKDTDYGQLAEDNRAVIRREVLKHLGPLKFAACGHRVVQAIIDRTGEKSGSEIEALIRKVK